jgi:hypothetical protein
MMYPNRHAALCCVFCSSQEEGLAQLVASCMERCAEVPVADPEDAGWFHNVLLMGGSACIPGLPGEPPCLLDSQLVYELVVGCPQQIPTG